MSKIVSVATLLVVMLAVGTPARAGGGGCHAAATTVASTTVSLRANCFGPTVTNVAVGDEVTFVNADAWNHTVTGAGLAWGSPANIGPEGVLTATFDEPGVYPYVCLLHPGMLGAVVVGDGGPTPATPAPLASTRALAAADVHGASWSFALGLALLAAVLGAIAGALAPRRRSSQD